MSAVQNSATPAATTSTSLAADAVTKAGMLRRNIAGMSQGFNLGDALAAAGYVALSFYGFVFLANVALIY